MIVGINIQQPKNAGGMTLLYKPFLHFLKTYHLFFSGYKNIFEIQRT